MIPFILSLTIGFSSNALAIPAQDDQFECLTSSEAERYILDFAIDVDTFGGMELCQNDKDTKKLFNDLKIVEQGLFRGTGTNPLIRNFISGNNYYSWLKSMTRGIERGNDIPYATAYNRGGYFTMQDGWSRLSTLGRVGTVVHEARHTAGYRHLPCQQGSYAGVWLDACDSDYASGGSHAIEMEYYARVTVQGENFHPVYQTMARLMAAARANFVFNQPVFRAREAIVALDQQTGTATLFDRGQRWERETPLFPGSRLKRTSYGAALFDGLSALAIEMYQSSGSNPLLKDAYSYFKLVDRDQGRRIDMEEFDVSPKRYVAAINSDQSLAFFDFPQGSWGSSVPTNLEVARTRTLLPDGRQGLFLISTSGSIHTVDPERKTVGSSEGNWNPGLLDVVRSDSGVMTLGANGVLRTSQGIDWIPAMGRRWSAAINVPLYDAFEVRR